MKCPTCVGCIFAQPLHPASRAAVVEKIGLGELPHVNWPRDINFAEDEEKPLFLCNRTHDHPPGAPLARIKSHVDRCGNGLWMTAAIAREMGDTYDPRSSMPPLVDYANAILILNQSPVVTAGPGIMTPGGGIPPGALRQ